MKKQIKHIVIFLLLIALALPVDERAVKASDDVNPDSAGESISPTPPSSTLSPTPPSGILLTPPPNGYILGKVNKKRNGAMIEFTWSILNSEIPSGVEIYGTDAAGVTTMLADVPPGTTQWSTAVSGAEIYTTFIFKPYTQHENGKSYGNSRTFKNVYKVRQTEIRSLNLFGKVLRWDIQQGDDGCSGIEVLGRDKDGNHVLIADLPATSTEYTVTEQAVHVYSAFILRSYIQNGTDKVYDPSVEIKNEDYVDGYTLKDGVVGIQSHTQAQIRAMYKKLSPQKIANKYKKKPKNKKPYAKGAVADSTLKNGLNTINFIRYVAGISHNVKIKKKYQSMAQAAAVLNYNDKTDNISPHPAKPAGMKNSLYREGCSGSSTSMLAAGYSTLYKVIISEVSNQGGLALTDGDSDNGGIYNWLLNPAMAYTGFGIDRDTYAVYSRDESNRTTGIHGVHWPAENTPLKFFRNNDSWSISMGTKVSKDITVTLTRARDKKRWVFTSKNSKKSGSYVSVNSDGHGEKRCIVFRPKSIKYKKGDKFTVSVRGSDFSFSYKVNFFAL